MKKTLFLAAMLACAVAPVSADLPVGCTSPDETGIIVNTGNRTISVGSYLGDAEMTVEDNVTLSMQLFIGGKGYGQRVTTGGSGTVTVLGGKTLDVAGQVGVGNTQILGATGTLILEAGSTLIADQIVVGSQNGQGKVIVGAGATMTTDRETGGTSGFDSTIIIGGASKDEEGNDIVSSGSCSGAVVVEEGGKLESSAGILVGSYGSGSGTLEVRSSEVDLAAVKIGGGSDATGEVIVDVASSSSVSMQDVTVANGGTLTVKQGSLEVSANQTEGTTGTITVQQGGSVVVESTNPEQSSSLSASTVSVDSGSMTVSGSGADVSTGTFALGNGATAELADSATVTVSTQMSSDSTSKVVFAYEDVKETTAETGTIVFASQEAANASQAQAASAEVRFDGAAADEVSSNTTLKLTSVQENGTKTTVGFSGYQYNIDGAVRDLEGSEVAGESGTVLQLTQQDVNNIVNDLSRDTTASSINSLNGALTTMTAFSNAVKGQIDAPHSVNLPVGNVASDSKLAYTGRYLVGANRVWVSGYGQSDRRATDAKGMGYHYQGGGYAVGYDRVVTPSMYVGAAVGQMVGKYKANDGLFRDHQNGVNLSLYGRYTHRMKKSDNALNVDVYLGYGNTRNRARGSFYAGGDEVTGRWNDTSLAGGVTISYDIILSDTSILSPFIGIDATYAMQEDFRMSNASGSSRIDYSDGKASLVTMPVGVTYRYVSAISNTEYLIPFLRVAYLADLCRVDPHADYVRGNAEKTRAHGATPARSGVELGAGLNWILNSQWMTGAGYTLQERSGDCDQRVNAYVSYSF
ncbi:MAG: autotransporter domain-containing protein [Akkermansia sp.]